MKMSQDNENRPALTPDDGQDRRSYHNLRDFFEGACLITSPFFDSTQGWGDVSLTFSALHVLRERYPDLTQQEVAILYAGVERYHKFRK
ncbi:MAG: hypothetical protein PHH47_02445 [Gallionella sp.]|nr:hypothetical protein [Gallionella sp.]MDD4946057.1 hypothetical protein [Gallionella sp.]